MSEQVPIEVGKVYKYPANGRSRRFVYMVIEKQLGRQEWWVRYSDGAPRWGWLKWQLTPAAQSWGRITPLEDDQEALLKYMQHLIQEAANV